MGKTVESYRMALESEINRWSGFARALCKPDREAGNACNPILFEPMVMSILLAQQARTKQLKKDPQTMNPKLVNPSKSQELNNEQSSLKTSIQKTAGGGGQLRLN
jgi:hypothetical protein